MRRVRTSTWILTAIFVIALAAYVVVKPTSSSVTSAKHTNNRTHQSTRRAGSGHQTRTPAPSPTPSPSSSAGTPVAPVPTPSGAGSSSGAATPTPSASPSGSPSA